MRGAALPLALLGLLVASCGGLGPPRRSAWLRVEAVPPSAAVYVDERFAGTGRALARQPVRLRPGRHLLTVRADGFFPHDMEVVLEPGLSRLRVKLRPVPP